MIAKLERTLRVTPQNEDQTHSIGATTMNKQQHNHHLKTDRDFLKSCAHSALI